MRFSLIVATRGRTKEVGALLDSLQGQTFQDFELIVADQNSDSRLLPCFANRSFPITHLHSYPGAAHARNTGIPYATGDIITFPDDDCTYPPKLLENTDRYFRENPEIDVLSVRSNDSAADTSITRFDLASGEINRYNIWQRSVEFTIFAGRKWFTAIQFDPDLGVGAFSPWQAEEGPDLIIRFQEAGAKARYEASLVIIHEQAHRTFDKKSLNRAFIYACGRGYFMRKHHYPWAFRAYSCGRSLLGCLSQVVRFNFPGTRYYWAYFIGKLLSSSATLSKLFLLKDRHSSKNGPAQYPPAELLSRI